MRASAREFAEFNGLLGSAVEKGLPLPPALRLMSGVVLSAPLRDDLAAAARDLDDGLPLAEALAKHPDSFTAEYCGLVRAGAESGRLPEVLRTVQLHHALRGRLRARMGRLLLYVLSGVAIGEIVLLIALAVGHRMVAYTDEVAQQLEIREKPELVDFIADVVHAGWILPLLWPAAVALGAAGFWIGQRWSRLGWLGYALPVWGRIQKSRDLAIFTGVAGMKLRSGSTLLDALGSARDTIVNRKFRRLVDGVIRRVGEGESLSSALFYTPFFPRAFSWGMSLGEENGEVARTFDTFTALYTAEMERNFEMMVDILTPLGILAVGNIALVSAVLILSPFLMILKIQQSLSR